MRILTIQTTSLRLAPGKGKFRRVNQMIHRIQRNKRGMTMTIPLPVPPAVLPGTPKAQRGGGKIDKSPAEVVPKSKTAASCKPKGRGRGGPKLLDTSNVVPHIRGDVYRASVDKGDMDDRKKDKPAPKRKK